MSCAYATATVYNRKLYTTSNGGVTVRATTHIETISQRNRAPRSAIIVTQLPYMVNKAGLLEKIAAMVNDKKLDGMCVVYYLYCILLILLCYSYRIVLFPTCN
jgi:DNA gyrase/topoisomerase IV subunit A